MPWLCTIVHAHKFELWFVFVKQMILFFLIVGRKIEFMSPMKSNYAVIK